VGTASERYERGLDAFASQFEIQREEVPAWLEERLGARFGEEALQARIHARRRRWRSSATSWTAWRPSRE
jgi:hypothetical protein